jgi:hypothetical protein
MRRLLKYGFVLALAVGVGSYVVLRPAPPASIDEELDHMLAERRASLEGWRAFLAAHQSDFYAQSARAEIARRLGASAAAPGAAPTDNGQGYKLSERLASLASYAHSATAKVERLLLPDEAPASGNPPISGQAPADERGASQPTNPVSSAAEGAVPATAAVSHDARLLQMRSANVTRSTSRSFAARPLSKRRRASRMSWVAKGCGRRSLV